MSDLIASIETKLTQAFAPVHLAVEDESHLHAGHRGAAEHAAEHGSTPSHVHIAIQSAALADMSRLARHRAVMAAIADEVAVVHALRLTVGQG